MIKSLLNSLYSRLIYMWMRLIVIGALGKTGRGVCETLESSS